MGLTLLNSEWVDRGQAAACIRFITCIFVFVCILSFFLLVLALSSVFAFFLWVHTVQVYNKCAANSFASTTRGVCCISDWTVGHVRIIHPSISCLLSSVLYHFIFPSTRRDVWFCESSFRLFLANTWQWLQGPYAKNISHIWMDFRITPPFRWNTDTMSSTFSTYIVSPIWGMHHDHPILTLWLATVWLVTIGVGCPRWEGGELSVCRPVKTVFLYMLISLWYKFVLSTVFVLNFCLASWYRRWSVYFFTIFDRRNSLLDFCLDSQHRWWQMCFYIHHIRLVEFYWGLGWISLKFLAGKSVQTVIAVFLNTNILPVTCWTVKRYLIISFFRSSLFYDALSPQAWHTVLTSWVLAFLTPPPQRKRKRKKEPHLER